MIEITLKDYLSEALGVSVTAEKPKGQKEYVLIDKTSSSEENQIKKATFAIQSYAETLYKALALNERVKTAMSAMININNISKVSLNTDYNFTDPETKEYRYQAVFDLVYME